MYRSITGAGNDSHLTQILYGGGPPLVNSAGVPWTAAYIDTIGESTVDLRSNIAAEARAEKVVSDPEDQMAVDGGDGTAAVGLTSQEKDVVLAMAARTASDAASDPRTGAELGMSGADALDVGDMKEPLPKQ